MILTHDAAAQRFEATTEHGVAVANYQRDGNAVLFTHTEVPEAAQGQGVGSALIGKALAWAKGEGLEIVPLCPFVAAYVKEHLDAA